MGKTNTMRVRGKTFKIKIGEEEVKEIEVYK